MSTGSHLCESGTRTETQDAEPTERRPAPCTRTGPPRVSNKTTREVNPVGPGPLGGDAIRDWDTRHTGEPAQSRPWCPYSGGIETESLSADNVYSLPNANPRPIEREGFTIETLCDSPQSMSAFKRRRDSRSELGHVAKLF